MPKEVKRYNLKTRYEISAEIFMVGDDGEPIPGQTYGRQTNERLSIEDSFDLQDSTTLTAVLAKIDTIHQVLRPQ